MSQILNPRYFGSGRTRVSNYSTRSDSIYILGLEWPSFILVTNFRFKLRFSADLDSLSLSLFVKQVLTFFYVNNFKIMLSCATVTAYHHHCPVKHDKYMGFVESNGFIWLFIINISRVIWWERAPSAITNVGSYSSPKSKLGEEKDAKYWTRTFLVMLLQRSTANTR